MKTDSKFQQRSKVGVAGLFTNQLMGNNASVPEVGKGATELMYSDRHCYEVIEVSKDFKTVKLEALEAKFDPAFGKPQMGHQNWLLEPTGHFLTVVWKWGSWKKKINVIKFTDEFNKKTEEYWAAGGKGSLLTEEQREQIYHDEVYPQKVIEGITRKAVEYHTIKIIFGVKDYHYDWEF